MKLPRYVRTIAWVIIIMLAASGIPLAGPVPLIFKRDDPTPATTELVEDREENEDSEDALF